MVSKKRKNEVRIEWWYFRVNQMRTHGVTVLIFFFFFFIHTAYKPKAYGIDRKIHAHQRKHNPFSSYANLGPPTSPPQYIRQGHLMPNITQTVTECHQRFWAQCPSRRVFKPINLSSANHLHFIILSIFFTRTFSDRALGTGG